MEVERISEKVESEYKYLWAYVQDKVQQLEVHRANAAKLQGVVDALGHALAEVEGASMYVGIYGKRVSAQVSGLNSFGEVAGLARIVAKGLGHGFARRDLNKEQMFVTLTADDFELTCYVNGKNATCKRVAVGTRMVEETIYETRCEGGEEPALDGAGMENLEPEGDSAPGEDAAGLPPLSALGGVGGEA